MRDFGTLDFESDPFSYGTHPQVFAGDLYFKGAHLLSWSPNCAELLLAECIKHKDVLFYAHNGGKFDFHFILQFLLEHFTSDELDIICIGARIVEIKTPTCIFRDSFSLIPKKLSAFGTKKELSIWKLAASAKFLAIKAPSGAYQFADKESELISEGWIRLNPDGSWRLIRAEIPRLIYREEITAYLKQDCVGLYDALQTFFGAYGCELTLAGTTFKILKKQFGQKPTRTNIHYDARFRPYYYSGRVQFFALGKQGELDGKHRYSIADINSAFPAAMLQKHWFGSEYLELKTPPKKNRNQCFYEITADSNGMLPMRMLDNSIGFPHVKNQKFFATGWELFTGLALGLVTRVRYHRIFLPLELADFSPYVNHFYAAKKACDIALKSETLTPEDRARINAEREFNKLILTNLYGKFGQDPRAFREVKISKCGDKPEPKKIPQRKGLNFGGKPNYELIDGKWYKLVEWEKSYSDFSRGITFWQLPTHDESSSVPLSFYNVSTAASITGCVRAFLARSMHACKGVLYCDTDSIVAEDISTLVLGDNLGDWKLEKKCDAIWIGGKKLYAAHSSESADKGKKSEWKTASKGVRLSIADLRAVCEGEEKTYSFDAPNYSVFSPQNFTSRRINRDDKRKRRVKNPV